MGIRICANSLNVNINRNYLLHALYPVVSICTHLLEMVFLFLLQLFQRKLTLYSPSVMYTTFYNYITYFRKFQFYICERINILRE
nr:MAG TPA_asm: hypothetical protein [Caudoviricetes sp.]